MTFPEFVSFLSRINIYSAFPAIFTFLILKKSMTKNAGILFLILLASTTADWLNDILIWRIEIRKYYPSFTSYPITSAWYIVNYILVCFLIKKLIPSRSRLINIFLTVFISGTILSYGFFYSIYESNSFLRVFSSCTFIVLSSLIFVAILKEGPIDELTKYPVFWIVSAIFIYSSTTLIKNIFANYMVFELEIDWNIYSYTSFFSITVNMIKNLMFAYAFILIKKGYPDYVTKPN